MTLADASDGRIGKRFGDRFRIERRIGDGGETVVYLAFDERHKRDVVLKILSRNDAANDVPARRFLREIEVTRRVRHPNIVHVFEAGETEKLELWLAMEVLKGRTLQRQVKQHGALEPERVAHVGAQIADALQAAHDGGVLHRDLKPSNIRLLETAETRDFVKVLDFGISRFLEDEGENGEQLTAAGKVIGSPHYMSPEQVASKTLDGRSDLYALGVLLYYMVVGQPPFSGKTLEILRRHVFDKPAPPSSLRPVPPELEAIILKLLAKAPEERFQSGSEVASALRLAFPAPVGLSFAAADEIGSETVPVSDRTDTHALPRSKAPLPGGAARLAAAGFLTVFAGGFALILVLAAVALLVL